MLRLSQDPAADQLISEDPLALLVAMVLDQQIPMQRAFAAPRELALRLGRESLDVTQLATYDPTAFAAIFAKPPALHRFPAAMAGRVQGLARVLVEDYEGQAAAVWTGATSGAALLRRLEGLPGFGRQKAQIFLALLGKQLGVRPRGWRAAAGPYGTAGVYKSLADITDGDSLARVRAYKQDHKRRRTAPVAAGHGSK